MRSASFAARRMAPLPRFSASVFAVAAPRAYTAVACASTKLFTKSHEWVEWDEAAKTAVLGLSNHAVKELNDITYIDLPAVGTKVEQDADICSIESVKAVVPMKAAINGTISEINSSYEDAANLAKLKDGGAEGEAGWILKLTGVSGDRSLLMTQEEFAKFIEAEH